MPHKGKLRVDEKVGVVEAYLSGEMSASTITKKCRINKQTLKDWVRLYKVRGVAGLHSPANNRKYEPKLKRQVAEEYLSGLASLRELCTKYDISNKSMLQQWIKRYNSHEDFKQPNSGGATYMTKRHETTLEESMTKNRTVQRILLANL